MNTVSYWSQNPPAVDHHGVTHMGNHNGPQAWAPLTKAVACQELQTSLEHMNAIVAKFPTAQDALNFGCYRATVYVKGIAAHYVCVKNYSKAADVDKPIMLLYGGSAPTAPIVGLSYLVFTADSPAATAGLPLWTKYMPFHYHEGLCTNAKGEVIGGDHSTKANCEAAGGHVEGRTGWMGHYWLNNCPSPDGVFSAENPRLDWQVALFNDDPKNAPKTASLVASPCQGAKMKVDPTGTDRFGAPTKLIDSANPQHDMTHATTTANGGHDAG